MIPASPARRCLAAGLLGAAGLAAPAAAQLDLTLNSVVDVSALNLRGMGGAAYDPATAHLWLSDGCGPGCPSPGTNLVFELDPLTGGVFSSFDAAVVPGLDVGPDGLALDPSSQLLFLFSPYIEDEGGSVTQAGVLVNDFPTAVDAPAAAVSAAGELFVVSDPAAGGDGALHRVNMVTGLVETTVPFVGYSGRVPSMDFDPVTGNLFVYADAGDALLEVDPATGSVLSSTDMTVFGLAGKHFATAFAFKADGTQLYLGKGADNDADVLYVFDRDLGIPCATVFCDVNPANASELAIDGCVCAAGSAVLRLSNAPPGQFGYPLVGSGTVPFTDPPGAVGDLCLTGAPIGRYAEDAAVTDAAGGASVDVLNALSGGGGGNIPTLGGNLCTPPDQTWNFQWWHRDGMNPSRFSKAIQVAFH